MSDAWLEYTKEFRALSLEYELDDIEPQQGANLCPPCFTFANGLPFGLFGPPTRYVTDSEDGLEDHVENKLPERSDAQHVSFTEDFISSHGQKANHHSLEPSAMSDDVAISAAPPSLSGAQTRPLKNFTWNLSLCLHTSSYCSICQHIIDVYLNWRSLQLGTGMQHVPRDKVNVEWSCGHYSPLLTTNKGYDDRGVWRVEDISELKVCMPEIHINAPPYPPYSSWLCARMKFQPIESFECTVEHFLEAQLDSSVKAKCEFKNYWGRIRPQNIQLLLLRFWVDRCISFHNNECTSILCGEDPVPKIRLIDVKLGCLVDTTGPTEYVALTYTWGTGNTGCLLKSNDIYLHQSGALFTTPFPLPATIADAITVTTALKERYLWVDSLCIIQDDDEDKARFLPVVHLIYAHATFTLVNAAGLGAQDGLPGVQPKTRSPPQVPFKGARDKLLVRSWQPLGDGTSINYLGESVWNTRAWTLQERLFSRRVIIFTSEQVYWECPVASWREDGNWEMAHPPLFREDGIYDEIDIFRKTTFDQSFRAFVQHYTKRKLTEPSDRLHAFNGVLKALSSVFGERFHWGLPVRFFASSLAWPQAACYNENEEFGRVTSLHIMPSASGEMYERVPFPSWSWVGWMCYVPWQENRVPLVKGDTILLRVYILDVKNELEELTDYSQSAQATPRNSYLGSDQTVLRQHIPTWLFTDLKRHTALHFWTMVAVVELNFESARSDFGSFFQRMVLRQSSTRIGYERVTHTPPLATGQARQVSLVLTSTSHDLAYIDPRPRLNVMLAAWKDGISYKVGMVVMLEEIWLQLDEREWKVVSLC